MDETTQKLIQGRFLELPKVIQDIITKSNWVDTVRKISQEHNLRIDQGGILENEVFLVMLGVEEHQNFLQNIIREAGIKEDLAKTIFFEISDKIFSQIKDKIIEETQNTTIPSETNTNTKQENDDLDRDNILKEIEDVDTEKSEDIISVTKNETATLNQPEATTEIAIKNPNNTALQNPVVKQSEVIKIDPYREQF